MTDVGTIDFHQLLIELESGSSGSCANVIRKLREHEVAAYEAGCGGPTGELIASFIACLDKRVSDKEHEIEETCGHNYQSFVDSVKELMCVQEKAEELKQLINDICTNIDYNSNKLKTSFEALYASHNTLDRIDQCISALQSCLPILDQYERVEKSIADGRYYYALKTLEQLEHYQLKSIQSYSFTNSLQNRIPILRSAIKTASLTQLTDFLEEIRKHSIRLGAIAMHDTAEKTGLKDDVWTFENKRISLDSSKNDEMFKHESKYSVLEAELEELAAAATRPIKEPSANGKHSTATDWRQTWRSNMEEVVNFSPVYRCLHIHAVSGERVQFEQYYFTQRKKQYQLILSLSPSTQANLRNYSEFFSTIVGFFLIDDYLCYTMPGTTASYQAYLTELWSNVVPKLIQLAVSNTESCSTAEELLNLKYYTVLFDRTMTGLGFHTIGLTEMFEVIRKRYNSILISKWHDRLDNFLTEDNFTAITISNQADVTPALAAYPFCNTPEFNRLTFPRVLVFSSMVPELYLAIRDYIDACFFFLDTMDLAWTELEDTLSRATNTLFTDCVNRAINRVIEQSERSLLRLIQLTINLNELESSCEHLQTYLHEKARPKFCTEKPSIHQASGGELEDNDFICYTDDPTVTQIEDTNLVHSYRSNLYGVSLFKDTRALVESHIYANLNAHIDELFGQASYAGIVVGSGDRPHGLDDYARSGLTEMQTTTSSQYIKDLMIWMSSTFAAFANLPPKVAQTACISACKYIVKLFKNVIMGPEVKMVAAEALESISRDLTECEKFAKSDPVPGIDESILLLIFQELRQLLDLVKNEDWKNFAKNYGKPGNQYDRVTPSVVINLLELIREAEKKGSSFLESIKYKSDRQSRKRFDDAIKLLKDVQTTALNRY